MSDAVISINGKRKLGGKVTVQGSKNSALPCLAACGLCDKGVCRLSNCPCLSDVHNTVEILEELGARCTCGESEPIIEVCAESLFGDTISAEMMNKMRSSVLFLGALLCRSGEAHVGYPGGCALGARPIDLHLKAFRKLGVDVEESRGIIHCRIREKLKPCAVSLICPSVGATENIMLLMAKTKGETTIRNAAREPEIVDLQNFINAMGGNIKGAGTDTVVINGVSKLHGADFEIMPDRIVAVTYMAAAVGCGGKILLQKTNPEHVSMCSSVLRDMGAEIYVGDEGLYVSMQGRPNAVKKIKTLYYPGFPTDAQPQFMTVSSVARGTTVFVESIFENRFRHASELCRMGADIDVNQCQATVRGSDGLSGTAVESFDLRGGAAMVIAGLIADGNTRVGGVQHIERGYLDIVSDFQSLGADIDMKLFG